MIRGYFAVSLDGCIADRDGGVGWLEGFDAAALGFDDFLAGIDTIVTGRTTYDQALGFGEWPYGGKEMIVVSRRELGPAAPAGVRRHGSGLAGLGPALADAGEVWVLGGAQLFDAMMGAGLVDRLELYVMPVILGGGIALFGPGSAGAKLTLVSSRSFPAGVSELVYDIAR